MFEQKLSIFLNIGHKANYTGRPDRRKIFLLSELSFMGHFIKRPELGRNISEFFIFCFLYIDSITVLLLYMYFCIYVCNVWINGIFGWNCNNNNQAELHAKSPDIHL